MMREKQTCSDCHFFIKETRGGAVRHSFPVTAEERTQAKTGDFSWVEEYYSLCCHLGVWDEGFNFDRKQRKKVIVDTDRRNFCFYWRFRPGMLIPAAKILQERESQAREASKDRRLSLWGLWIAALALLANTGLKIAEQFNIWSFLKP